MFNEKERVGLEDAYTRAVALLLEVDKRFEDYDLGFATDDASKAAASLGRADIAAFIVEATAFLWPEQPARDAYTIRIGRKYGVQVVRIDLFKGFFPDTDRLADEIEAMAMRHGAIRCGDEEGLMGTEIWMRWERS